jgi:phosphoglycolate phosphatase
VSIARARARQKYGVAFDQTNTVIVGDTPRDVEAGRSGGARVVAVASGIHDQAELRGAGADVVLPNLADTTRVLAAVLAEEPGHSGSGDVSSPYRRLRNVPARGD